VAGGSNSGSVGSRWVAAAVIFGWSHACAAAGSGCLGRKTLRKLVEAGPAVFDERGLNAARVDDVVRLAPTSHGAFELPAQCWDQAAQGGKGGSAQRSSTQHSIRNRRMLLAALGQEQFRGPPTCGNTPPPDHRAGQ
jgi:hypothetical protein